MGLISQIGYFKSPHFDILSNWGLVICALSLRYQTHISPIPNWLCYAQSGILNPQLVMLCPIGYIRSPIEDNMSNWGYCLLILYYDRIKIVKKSKVWQTQTVTKLKMLQVFKKTKEHKTRQFDEIYSGQSFAILRCSHISSYCALILTGKGSHFLKKRYKYGNCPNLLNPLLYFGQLRSNFTHKSQLWQNATKEHKT